MSEMTGERDGLSGKERASEAASPA